MYSIVYMGQYIFPGNTNEEENRKEEYTGRHLLNHLFVHIFIIIIPQAYV